MKMTRRTWENFSVLVLVFLLGVPAGGAQQKDPRVNPPVAPMPPLPAGESSSAAPGLTAGGTPAAPQAESKPLSSVEAWKLGGATARNYWIPSLTFQQGGDTRPGNTSNASGISAVTFGSGELAVHRLFGRQEFTAVYKGGGSFYSTEPDFNSWFQQFDFTHKILGRRWSLLVGDSVNYAQDRNGGFGSGFGGLPGVGGGSQLVNPNAGLIPNQSILTTSVPRLSNTTFGEWQYRADRRSTLTVSGSYGLLRFLEPGPIDGSNTNFGAGYNYTLTGKGILGVSYAAGFFRYSGYDQTNDSHTVYFSYGRQVSGRLAFDFGAGPQVSLVHRTGQSDTILSWAVRSSLRYRFQNSSMGLSYSRSVTGGSGLFLGAQTHDVSVSWSRRLSRNWDSSWNAGYANNQALTPTSGLSNGQTYNTWHGGLGLSRPVGRYTRVGLNYGISNQESNQTCTGTACGITGIRHVFGISFSFRFRPIDID